MIELKLQLWGAEQLRLTSEYLAKMAGADAREGDRLRGEAPSPEPVEETVKRVVEEAQAEEPAPKKRGRPKKEETQANTAPVEAETANISATPEDRRDPSQPVEDAVVVEEAAPEMTEQNVRDALGKLVAKKGMADAMTWVKTKTGFSKMSEIVAGVAEGKTTFREFVLLVEAEIGQ